MSNRRSVQRVMCARPSKLQMKIRLAKISAGREKFLYFQVSSALGTVRIQKDTRKSGLWLANSAIAKIPAGGYFCSVTKIWTSQQLAVVWYFVKTNLKM